MTDEPKIRSPGPVLVNEARPDGRKATPDEVKLDDTLSDSFPASDPLPWSGVHAGEPAPQSRKDERRAETTPAAQPTGAPAEQPVEITGQEARQAVIILDSTRKRWIYVGIAAACVVLFVAVIVLG